MSASSSLRELRRALPSIRREESESFGSLDLIGVDMAPHHATRPSRFTIPLIASVVLAALILVGLRIDLIRMRYAGADALAVEQELRDQKLAITVEMRKLRDPKQLSRRAKELGFVHPERVVDLVERRRVSVPQVAAGPRP